MPDLVTAWHFFKSAVTFSNTVLHNNESEHSQGYTAYPDIFSSGTRENSQILKEPTLIDSFLLNCCAVMKLYDSGHFSLYKGLSAF